MLFPDLHRVIHPSGALLQAAEKLNPDLPLSTGEILVDVEMLSIDSNSYRQIREACNGNENQMKEMILTIVAERGKMHNPVTGSGGMLIGTVSSTVDENRRGFTKGDKIATLVSLTLTPLKIQHIVSLNPRNPIVRIEGHAILLPSSIAVRLPDDIKETVALAALDVCGAPKLMQLYCEKSKSILILGGGKSGILSAMAAVDTGCSDITILEQSAGRVAVLNKLNQPFKVICANAKDIQSLAGYFQQFDLTFDCMNIPNAEMAAVLCTKSTGKIIYFNTATSFTQAALGAEGVGSEVTMLIGNGFYPGHAEYSFELIRKYDFITGLLNE